MAKFKFLNSNEIDKLSKQELIRYRHNLEIYHNNRLYDTCKKCRSHMTRKEYI